MMFFRKEMTYIQIYDLKIQEIDTQAPAYNHRQSLIDRVTGKLLSEKHTEKEAMSMFLWKLSEIEPSITFMEQNIFCARYRMFKSFKEISIENTEVAFEILGIPKSKLGLPGSELIKAAKSAYWEHFNSLTGTLHDMLSNAREVGIKKKALSYLIQ